MSLSCNQVYKREKTFKEHPNVCTTYWELDEYCKSVGFVNNENISKGRLYDFSVILNSGIDFTDKKICELGARDSIFGSYLTKYGKVHMSDVFKDWNEMPGYKYWTSLWKSAAINPNNLLVEPQDITHLIYPDNSFDIVICTSVIDHLYTNYKIRDTNVGDLLAMSEMVRISKPGGYIALSVNVINDTHSIWYSGTYYYCIDDLYTRIINYPGCSLYGSVDFIFDEKDTDIVSIINSKVCSSVIFILKITK